MNQPLMFCFPITKDISVNSAMVRKQYWRYLNDPKCNTNKKELLYECFSVLKKGIKRTDNMAMMVLIYEVKQ